MLCQPPRFMANAIPYPNRWADMTKPDLLIIAPIGPVGMAQVEAAYACHKLYEAPDKDALLAQVADRITAAATNVGVGASAALMAKLPKLKMIGNLGVGYETVDVAAARAHGVAVTNTPDVLNDCVADLAMALLLAAVRRIPQGDVWVRTGKWVAQGPMPLTGKVSGKRAGILGLGRIGRTIARRLEGFDCSISYSGPSRKADVPYTYYADPAELAAAVDFLIVATPGGAATEKLVDAKVLKALGAKGTLINIARGSVLDELAVAAALKDGTLGAAGLDVFVHEPKVPAEFMTLDNVVLAPHVGSATHETRRAMQQLVVDNIAAHFAGKPLLTPVS
jgi:hydroxypyruvate reductase